MSLLLKPTLSHNDHIVIVLNGIISHILQLSKSPLSLNTLSHTLYALHPTYAASAHTLFVPRRCRSGSANVLYPAGVAVCIQIIFQISLFLEFVLLILL